MLLILICLLPFTTDFPLYMTSPFQNFIDMSFCIGTRGMHLPLKPRARAFATFSLKKSLNTIYFFIFCGEIKKYMYNVNDKE